MLELLLQSLAARAPVEVRDPARAEAAVALLLVPDPDKMLLVKRAERVGDPWSGHLALPGGRRDVGDDDLLATAMRETQEETGIVLERGQHRATLDDLAPLTPVLPPILVRPFVFRLPHTVEATLSHELTLAAWVLLADLTAPGVYREEEITIRGVSRQVSGYRLPEGFLWGMTERIVTPVVTRWAALEGGKPDGS